MELGPRNPSVSSCEQDGEGGEVPAQYATVVDRSGVISGVLQKKTPGSDAWVRRWIVLKENELVCYKCEGDGPVGQPVERIPLQDAGFSLVDTRALSAGFTITGANGKVHSLRADVAETDALSPWVRHIMTTIGQSSRQPRKKSCPDVGTTVQSSSALSVPDAGRARRNSDILMSTSPTEGTNLESEMAKHRMRSTTSVLSGRPMPATPNKPPMNRGSSQKDKLMRMRRTDTDPEQQDDASTHATGHATLVQSVSLPAHLQRAGGDSLHKKKRNARNELINVARAAHTSASALLDGVRDGCPAFDDFASDLLDSISQLVSVSSILSEGDDAGARTYADSLRSPHRRLQVGISSLLRAADAAVETTPPPANTSSQLRAACHLILTAIRDLIYLVVARAKAVEEQAAQQGTQGAAEMSGTDTVRGSPLLTKKPSSAGLDAIAAPGGSPGAAMPVPPPRAKKIRQQKPARPAPEAIAAAMNAIATSNDDDLGLVTTTEEVDGVMVERIKGGRLDGLIVYLTRGESANANQGTDPMYLKTFLTTYRSFTTPNVLLQKLIERYHEPRECRNIPEGDPQNVAIRKVIQLRVCNLLRKFLEGHWEDFDAEMVSALNEFMYKIISDGQLNIAKQLRTALLKKKRATGQGGIKSSRSAPVPIKPNPPGLGRQLTLLDISSEELARQLTIVDSELYRKIRTPELLIWNKSQTKTNSPNVFSLIQRFNKVSLWVSTLILTQPHIKDRVKVMAKILDIAKHLKALNNFNSLMALLSGLNNAAVSRLKFTKEELPRKEREFYDHINVLMDFSSSYKNYRNYLHMINPPCVPYIGVYLTDLTFINDGNPDFVSPGIINFTKRHYVYKVVLEIHQYQQDEYYFTVVKEIVDFFKDFEHKTDEELYKLSMAVEPRKATREEIA